MSLSTSTNRMLVAIPAYNEEATIGQVVGQVREFLPDFDLLVVNDGSSDATGQILRSLGVVTATHLCNLGYGSAIQTMIKYASRAGYHALVALDADGQHHPQEIPSLIQTFNDGQWDVLIGSRYVENRMYSGAPFARRMGMLLFSALTALLAGQRVYDTSSGLKIMRHTVFDPLTIWHFVDFHAETIVYLLRLGYRIGEHPITVAQRRYGQSMYSRLSYLVYPPQTFLMMILGVVQAELTRRRR